MASPYYVNTKVNEHHQRQVPRLADMHFYNKKYIVLFLFDVEQFSMQLIIVCFKWNQNCIE